MVLETQTVREKIREIDAAGLSYQDLNAKIHEALQEGAKEIRLLHVNGQRYIADGLTGDIRIEIHGTPGDDLGSFMSGPTILVYGSVQDGIGNTMNCGKITVHGDARDIVGHSMRGGVIFVKGDVGYRVGIHMKEYMDNFPVIVAGGVAGDFLGEYMAGGRIVILGIKEGSEEAEIVGDWIATGIHGGAIYIRGEVNEEKLGVAAKIAPFSSEDREYLRPLLTTFCREFGYDVEKVLEKEFTKITPLSHRPFGKMYAE
jgi:glutamate synthase domain-containing protein 3